MPWQEASAMSLRAEFVALASQEGANVRGLCRAYRISHQTAYKWLARAAAEPGMLTDRSRRPHTSPRRTDATLEAALLELRVGHPAWGARKLRQRLRALGYPEVPSASTVHAILVRHGRIAPTHPAARGPWQRFERAAPNQLWQMDFKGHIPLAQGMGRCHPLTILDDHSRFNIALAACADEHATTVRHHLTDRFRRYGLPDAMLMDNGAPWGDARDQPYTVLGAWLIRLGIGVCHIRPYHPQTQGKEERFHRTLKAEALGGPPLADLATAQARFDRWRDVYNLERPHHALGYTVPAARYRPSDRPFPEVLPPIAYGPDDLVRRVFSPGCISLHNRRFHVGRAFVGQPVALRPTGHTDTYAVYFCHQHVATLDLRSPDPAS